MKFTLVFSAVGVGAGETTYGDSGHSGLVHVQVEAEDWKGALVVFGKRLSNVLGNVPTEEPEKTGPSVWERLRMPGPQNEEARRLAVQWLEGHQLLPDGEKGPRVESLTGLIEGLLTRSQV